MIRRLSLLVPAGGVLVASSAAIMIRLAQAGGYPSISLAAGRLGSILWLVRPVTAVRALGRVPVRDLGLCVVSGFFLALHFGFWVSSLEFTSVAGSVALVTTSPLWVAILGPLFLRERPRPLTLLAALVAIVGALLIGAGDLLIEASEAASGTLFSGSLRGNTLALLGALSVSGYLLVGRAVRARMALGSYVRLVYSSAAVVLCGAALAVGTPLAPPEPRLLVWAVLLALGPQLLGHTAFNWALKHFSALVVTVVILAEPVGSAVLAAVILREFPALAPLELAGQVFHLPFTVVGIVVLLSGVLLAVRSE